MAGQIDPLARVKSVAAQSSAASSCPRPLAAQVADLSAYTVIVTRQLDVASANLVVNSDYGGTDVPVPDGVGPNSRFVRVGK